MPDRRRFLQSLSSLPLVGGLFSAERALAAVPKRDFFKELGVRPFINAAGTYTSLTGSLMPPEVAAAWNYASQKYVSLSDLQDAVGRRIASLIGCEAAMVTAGAASALTVGTAACLTGTNQELISRLPDTTGMKSEVIIQKSHLYGHLHSVRNCGIRFIWVESRKELENAINERTAMMLFMGDFDPRGQIKIAEFAELGKKHGVPTFNDAAANLPPVENLSKFIKMGYDLVTFSGGKGLCGPQSAGLLLGRKDLIQAARLNTCPNDDCIGRGHKVNKEELLAMMVAVERYLKRDHEADWREWEKRVKLIADYVTSIKGVTTEVWIPDIANQVPHLRVSWDQNAVKLTVRQAVQKLREGEPSIEIRTFPDCLVAGVWMMQRGDAQVVARRLREILKAASA